MLGKHACSRKSIIRAYEQNEIGESNVSVGLAEQVPSSPQTIAMLMELVHQCIDFWQTIAFCCYYN